MKQLTILLAAFLTVGHLLTEAASFLGNWVPSTRTIILHPFPGTDMEISMLWYVKFMFDDLLWIIVMLVLCKVTYQYSIRLFRACCVFFLYHLIDMVLFMYNYKQFHNFYLLMIMACVIAVVAILYPSKKREVEGNVKSLY